MKTGVRGTKDLPHPVFSVLSFISHALYYQRSWEVVREMKAPSQWAYHSANRGATYMGHWQMNGQATELSQPGLK